MTTVGGSFQPGIEAGEIMLRADVFERPFRINRNCPAGALTQSLAVPWQTDFEACGQPWWPGGRPSYVTADGGTFYSWHPSSTSDAVKVSQWSGLGFLHRFEAGGREVNYERERLLPPASTFTGV